MPSKSGIETSGLLVLSLLVLVGYLMGQGLGAGPSRAVDDGRRCFVQIGGEVAFPGVYGFSGPPSIEKLIDAAGGLQGPWAGVQGRIKEAIPSGTRLAAPGPATPCWD